MRRLGLWRRALNEEGEMGMVCVDFVLAAMRSRVRMRVMPCPADA